MTGMDVGRLIREARMRAGLSQRALADLAGTSAAAVCLYERGGRIPRVDTVARLLHAAGEDLVLSSRPMPQIDVRQNAADLWQVLELADLLPQHHEDHLDVRPFAELVGRHP